jgi:hypothetical protein
MPVDKRRVSRKLHVTGDDNRIMPYTINLVLSVTVVFGA